MTCTGFQKEVMFYCFFMENVKRCTFSKFSVALLSMSETILCSFCAPTCITAIVSCQFYANGSGLGPLLSL